MNDDNELMQDEDVEQTELAQGWKQAPSLEDLKANYTDALSDHQLQIEKIQHWLDNLNVTGSAKPISKDNKNQVESTKTRSEVQPKLIRKHAEWRYSSLSESFLSTPDIYNVNPVTYEDVEPAEQNQAVLNNQFNTKLNKVKFIDEYVRKAVNEGTIVVRVGWESEDRIEEEDVPVYEYVGNLAMLQVHQEVHQLHMTNPTEFNNLPEALLKAHEVFMATGNPVEAIVVGSEKQEKLKSIKNQPTVKVCDSRRVIIDPTCDGNIDEAEFVIYEFETSYSELKRQGIYSNLDVMSPSPTNNSNTYTDAEPSFTFKDKPRKKFWAYEYWGFWDIDGSGITKPIVATWAGDTLIRLEENPYPDGKIPFVVVPYLPVDGSVYGEPDGSLIEDNQKIIGAVTRGMIDIMSRNAAGQRGTAKDALDVTNKRKFMAGRDFEYNPTQHPENSFWINKFADIPVSAQYMINLQTAEAESMSGIKAFGANLSGDALGSTATGVRGALDAISIRELGILRRLAQGMVEIGRKIIAMNAVWLSDEEVIRITNKTFRTIRRDDLAGNFDLDLAISTAAADNQRAQELSFMLQTLGNTVPFDLSKMLLEELAELRKMPALAKRIADYAPEPDPLAVQKAQLEIEKLKAEIAEIYATAQEKGAGAYKKSAEADKTNLDYVEQETGTKQERDLQKQGAQARANMDLKLLEFGLNQRSNTES